MKTLKDLLAVLDTLGLPYVQITWSPQSAPDMPFIVIRPDWSDNRSADNVVLSEPIRYYIELYTRTRDVALEKRVQQAFTDAGFFYNRRTDVVPDGYSVLTSYSMMLFE